MASAKLSWFLIGAIAVVLWMFGSCIAMTNVHRPADRTRLVWPVAGPDSIITAEYGAPRKKGRTHQGTDITHRKVDGLFPDIAAAGPGVVTHAGEHERLKAYGVLVVIDHGEFSAWYGHLEEGTLKVSEGDRVIAGQTLGRMGTTGNSTGPHLHYEIRVGKHRVDPLRYYTKKQLAGLRFRKVVRDRYGGP